jgi:hypothetical protein
MTAIIAGAVLSAMPIFPHAAIAQPAQPAAASSPMPGETLAFDRSKGIIFDETKRNPLTVMPPFGRNLILTKQEIDSVVDFLYTR